MLSRIFLIISYIAVFLLIWFKNETVYVESGYLGKLFNKTQDFCNLQSYLKEKRVDIERVKSLRRLQEKRFDKLVVFEIFEEKFQKYSHYPKEKLILFLWEPPSVLPLNYDKKHHETFSKIYTWDDSLVDNKKYFKFYYPELRPMIVSKPFLEKKLLIMVASNKVSSHPDALFPQRLETAKFFDGPDFDLYGKGWVGFNTSYKGMLSSKESLCNYKFCICYENMCKTQGYITEKIFDCFHAACVPIYWGADNITDYVPENCFIDRRKFKDNKELYNFLINMKEEEHEVYLKNIRLYLASDKAKLYSQETFRKIFQEALGLQ